jgi:Ni/Co efflux regulator RcnB
MKTLTKLVFCIAAAGAIAPAFAFAPAPQDWHHDDHRDRRDDHHDDRHDNRDRHDDHGYRHDDRRADWRPGPGGHWERGHRYDGRVVIVNDYRTRRLREPPRGYHWVRADNNDLLLVAITTGIIADIVSQ